MSSSTRPQAWETALDARFARRLSPLRSRVIDPQFSQRLYTRSQFLSDRVSLFQQFCDRYLTAAEWQPESLPIVYAHPVVSNQQNRNAQDRGNQVTAAGTPPNRDRTAVSSLSGSSPASAPLVMQAKFASSQATRQNSVSADSSASSLPIALPIVRGTWQNSGLPTASLQAVPHPAVIPQPRLSPRLEAYAQPDLIQAAPVQNPVDRTISLIEARSPSHFSSTDPPFVISPHAPPSEAARLPIAQGKWPPPSEVKPMVAPLPQVHSIRAPASAIAERPAHLSPRPGEPLASIEPASLPQVPSIPAQSIQTLEASTSPWQAAVDPSFVFVQPSVQPAVPSLTSVQSSLLESSSHLNPVETARLEPRSHLHTEAMPAQEPRQASSTADPIPQVQSPPINIDALVDTVERKLMRRLIIEQERRG